MGTPASIIKRNTDGTFESRYVNYDGDSIGIFLQQNLSDSERVDALFAENKDFSSLMMSVNKQTVAAAQKMTQSEKDLLSKRAAIGDLTSFELHRFCKESVRLWPFPIVSQYKSDNDEMFYEVYSNGKTLASKNASWANVLDVCQGYDYIFEKDKWLVLQNYPSGVEPTYENRIVIEVNTNELFKTFSDFPCDCTDIEAELVEYYEELEIPVQKIASAVKKMIRTYGKNHAEEILKEQYECPEEVLNYFEIKETKKALQKSLKGITPSVVRKKKI